VIFLDYGIGVNIIFLTTKEGQLSSFEDLKELKPEKVLIRAPNWLGDAVMAVPSMQMLRKHFKDSHITVASQKPLDDFYTAQPWCDDVVIIEKNRGLKGIRARYKSSRSLEEHGFDVGILYPNSFPSALEMKLGKIPIRVGFGRAGRSFLLTHSIKTDPKLLTMHQVVYYVQIARAITEGDPSPKVRSKKHKLPPVVSVDRSVREKVKEWIIKTGIGDPSQKKPIVFAPGAAYGSAKQWPQEHYAALASLLYKETGTKVILVGSPGERKTCNAVVQAVPDAAISFCGETTIPELAGILFWARWFVGNDSGASHLAAAIGIPSVVLFGPTKMSHTVPLGIYIKTLNRHLKCSPCMKRKCPLGHKKCLTDITPDEVWGEIKI
jgi:heptosyltransferase-2